jgi:cell division GTPase FtsZ
VKVIGLGNAGCNIVRSFSKFPQYDTYTIDTNKEADITIKKRNSHEEYDEHFPNLRKKFKFANDDVFVVVAGSGRISGATLQLLEQLKSNRITVLYIQADLSLASEVQKKQEKIVKNILQEFARSGMIETVLLLDNQMIEKGIGDVAIMGYYDVLNQAIVNTIHMINVFKNSEAVLGNFSTVSDLSRIGTIGILDIEESREKWFFNLTNVRDVVYYYGINEAQLEEDGTLFKVITNYVKSKLNDDINISYGVFKTTYDQKYCYCIKYSSMVQSFLDDQDIS